MRGPRSVGGGFQFLHELFQLGLVGVVGDGLPEGGHRGADILDCLGREDIALVVQRSE